MNDDLISMKALLEKIDEVMAEFTWEEDGLVMDTHTCVRDMVCEQPKAYDVDRVIALLEQNTQTVMDEDGVARLVIPAFTATFIVRKAVE